MRRPQVPTRAVLLLIAIAGAITLPAIAMATTNDTAALLATPGNDTVTQLRLPSSDGDANERLPATADLSGTLTAESERLESALEGSLFEQRFQAAPQTQEQPDAVEATVDRLEKQAKTLRESRQDAVRAYDAGEITASELFREISRIRTAARGLTQQSGRIESAVEASEELSLSNELSVRLSSIQAHLVSLDGPVAKEVTTIVHGSTSSRSIYVDTDDDGIVLGMIDDDQFVREATVWSARGTTGPDQFAEGEEPPPAAAYRRAEERYPWASTNLVSSPSLTGIGDTPIYVVGLNHQHGKLTAYLDGRTTDVFYEVQRLRLSQLPTETVATNETDALSMTVEGTFEDGPIAVDVTDSEGQPVHATVRANGETVGSTGTDGRLWLVDTGAEERITAESDSGQTIAVTVEG